MLTKYTEQTVSRPSNTSSAESSLAFLSYMKFDVYNHSRSPIPSGIIVLVIAAVGKPLTLYFVLIEPDIWIGDLLRLHQLNMNF